MFFFNLGLIFWIGFFSILFSIWDWFFWNDFFQSRNFEILNPRFLMWHLGHCCLYRFSNTYHASMKKPKRMQFFLSNFVFSWVKHDFCMFLDMAAGEVVALFKPLTFRISIALLFILPSGLHGFMSNHIILFLLLFVCYLNKFLFEGASGGFCLKPLSF